MCRRWCRRVIKNHVHHPWLDWHRKKNGFRSINVNVLPRDTVSLSVCLCVCLDCVCMCTCVCLSGEVSSRHQQHFSPVSSGLASLCTNRLMNRSVHTILLRTCPDAVCFLLSQGPWISWWPWVHLMQLGRGALPPLNKVLSRRSLCSRCSKHHKTLNTEHRGRDDNFHVFSLCTQACTMPEMKQTIEQTLVVSVEPAKVQKASVSDRSFIRCSLVHIYGALCRRLWVYFLCADN